jgi:hypothetical protein
MNIPGAFDGPHGKDAAPGNVAAAAQAELDIHACGVSKLGYLR